MNNQENQDIKQETPVTGDQSTTQTTAPVADTKPAERADNTQDATAPETVKLELTADQAEMVQDLLSDFVYAYRSDREVDCKRELVRRDKIGKYPYVAEPADPSIINPTYDWINKKWYSKSGSTSLPEIAQDVQSLQSNQEAGTTQSLALTKAVKQLSEGQADQEKLLASVIASAQKTAEPTAPTQSTQATNK